MPTCEKCGSEYESGQTACPKCGGPTALPPPAPVEGRSSLDGLQMLFVLMAAIPGVFHLIRPATNTGQLIFRLSVSAIGIIGFIVVTILKFRRS